MTRPETTLRRTVLSGLMAMLTAPAPSAFARNRDASAEQFVQKQARRALQVLADPGRSLEQKRADFRQLIDEMADVPRITNFVLGRYARTISPQQKLRFAAVFRVYAEHVYRNRLNDYHGEELTVNGSNLQGLNDAVVETVISGGRLHRKVPVSWRVMKSNGSWKIVDVQFRGIWLAITQQQDFVTTIDNAQGDVEVLIAQLQRHVNGKS